MSFGATPERGPWRWTPEQDVALFRRRHVDRMPFKTIAYEFGRSEPTVANRFARIQDRFERQYGDVLKRHREEELELLERLLSEAER